MTRLLVQRVVAGAAAGYLALALSACTLLPGASISRDHAIAVAFDRVKLANPVMFSAVEGRWVLGVPRRAWVVTFRGGYVTCEGPGARGSQVSQPCRLEDGQAVIYVDMETGEFLGGDVGGQIDVGEGR